MRGSPLDVRFYIDPATSRPHIERHGVTAREVEEVLKRPAEDRAGRDGCRVALGRSAGGRFLRVIYVPEPQADAAFVITAYDLTGKPLAAFRKRMRRKKGP